MKKYFKTIFIILASVFLAACNYQVDKTKPGGGYSAQQLSSFDAMKLNILDTQCLRCHGPSGSGGVDLSSYNSIMANPGLVVVGHNESSRLYTEVATGDMPQNAPALSPTEVAAIRDWINSGAPNGEFSSTDPTPPTPPVAPVPTPAPAPTPTPAQISYAEIQTKIFDQSCVRCHTGTNPSGNINLSSYQKLFANTKKVVVPGAATRSIVYTEITGGSMPPRGAKIDANLVLLLKNWINAGALNN